MLLPEWNETRVEGNVARRVTTIADAQMKKSQRLGTGTSHDRRIVQACCALRLRAPKTAASAIPARAMEPGSGTSPPGGGGGNTGFKVATKFSLNASLP